MNEAIIAGASAIGTFLIMWGMTRGKVLDLERRTMGLELSTERQLELVHSLRDVYVSREHFNEIMVTIKESQRDLKEDLKKILEILATR